MSLYLAEPERNDLLYADRDQAIPVSEGGQRVSCIEGPETLKGCPGWEAGAHYIVSGTVRYQVAGGRETSLIEIDVTEKRRG